jgi:protoporphyrinogen oxidase
MKKILIIGGGISGLSAGYHLTKQNKKFILFEKENELGGLCKTISANGFSYDFTGHLLHFSSKQTEDLAKDLLGNNLSAKTRKSFIFFKDKYIDYPFQQNLYNLPTKIKKECLFGYLETFFAKSTKTKKQINNFKKWALQNFGEGISKYFMIPYNEKLWNMEISELTTTWMKGYVPKPNLEQVLTGTFSDNKNKVGYNAKFYYPKKGGIQSLVDAFEKNIDAKNIKKNTTIKKISIKNKTITDDSGKKFEYDFLITSAPLKHLILNMLEDAPLDIQKNAKNLKTNTVLNINLGINKNLGDKHWIYFPEKKYIFYRLGFNNNFSKNMCPKNCSSIYTEISLDENFDFSDTKKIEKYKNQVIKDLIKTKILKSQDEVVDINILNLAPAYISYDSLRDPAVASILDYLKKNQILSIGRYGCWEYSDMETAILQGQKASEI